MADNEYIGIGQDLFSSGSEPAKQPGAKFGVYAADAEPVRGESVEIARELNLPVGTVERNFDELSKLAKRKRIDYDKIATDSPLTNDWLSDPVNASVAQDDIENLSGIEQAWGYLKKGGSALASGLPKFNEGIYGAAQFGVDTARTYVTKPLLNVFDPEALPYDPLRYASDYLGELRQGQSGLAGRMMPKADGITEQGVYSGLQSLGQNMLTLPAAILSGNPAMALGPMVGGVAGSEYGRATDKGLPYSQAAIYATSQAAVEYATEKLPMGMLIKDLEKNTGFISMLGKQIAAELPSEQVATLLQDLNEWAALNPEKPFSSYLAERPNAAWQTAIATVVGAGGMVATGTAINKAATAFDARANKAAKAADTRKALDRLNNLVAQTTVKNVSPSTMKAFTDHVAQGGSVYIDAKDLVNSLQQSGIDVNQAMADIPSVGAQLNQQAAIGNNIKIPASEFLNNVAGTEYAQAMLDHLKLDPNDLSQAEADEIIKGNNETAKAEVARIIKHKRYIDAHEASADIVRKQFEEQLNTANRFSKDVNRTNAQLISSFYSAYAAKVGVTPEELAKQYPLRVTAAGVSGANTLDQSRKLYHGTPEDFEQFDKQYGGIYFAEDPAVSEFYAHDASGIHYGARAFDVNVGKMFDAESADAEEVLNRVEAEYDNGTDYKDPDDGEYMSLYRWVKSGQLFKLGRDVQNEVMESLRAEGYDSVRYLDASPATGDSVSVVVFDPSRPNTLNQSAQPLPDTIDIDGQQRPTRNSNGKPIAQTEEGVRNFWRWFGDSKVVDEQGRPLVVYHGTASPVLDEFTLSKSEGGAAYFTASPWVAGEYAKAAKGNPFASATVFLESRGKLKAEHPNITPVYLKIDNPATQDQKGAVKEGSFDAATFSDAKENKKDGVIFTNVKDMPSAFWRMWDRYGEASADDIPVDTVYAVFDPNQIKSAVGNSGTFDAGIPNILYQSQAVGDFVNVDGVQRPTLNSSGKQIAPTIEGVKRFWRWFGDSKAVDSERRPKVYYHGTKSDFDKFYPSPRTNGLMFFTADKDYANRYASPEGDGYASLSNAEDLSEISFFEEENPDIAREGRVIDPVALEKVYENYDLRISGENAKELAESYEARFDQLTAGGNVMPVYIKIENPAPKTYWKDAEKQGADKLSSSGYDSIVIDEMDTDTVAVFTPEQIKSAVGNSGAFDPNDPNILNQDDTAPNAQISFANDITSTPTVITLLKGADLTSFLHESGHFFLEVLNDISSQPNAPKSMTDDFNAVMEWFGVDSATWNRMTLEEKRPYHEKFARGFETYAWEGKAPSMALNKVFQRFRAWMLDAYKKLLDAFNTKDLGQALDVKLSDEVRAVFDRMLATQEQIDEANAVRGSLPMFETKEQAEKAGVDWEQYQADIEQSKQDAVTTLEARSLRDMRWFRNAHNREVRRLRRESASLRREARIDARAEVMSSPIYQAVQFLTAPVDVLKAKKAKGDPNIVDPVNDTLLVAVAKLGGLQRDMAVDQFGLDPADFKTQPVFSKPVLRKTGGLTPDGMAEALAQLGYLPSKNGTWDLNDLGDFLHDEGKGIPHYSATFDYRNLEEQQAGLPDLDANPFVGGRLDRDSMVREYGGSVESFPWESLGKMVSNEGIHPDVIADRFGFSSGDEMVRALLEAKDITTAIEDTTDRMMFERHGDLTSQDALNKAADEAIHNQMRAKVLATEANALAKTMGAKGVTAKAAKLFAERILAGMRILDIKPNHFAAEESKAAARFEKARAKGNTKDAAMEKRNQLVNNIATRLAYEAETEVGKKVKHFKQLQKPGSQKAMRGEYLEQLNALLDRFDLRSAYQTKKAAKRATELPVFADWLKAKAEELGQPTPEMVPFVLDGGVSKPYTDLTLEEFRGLVDAVAQLEHMARREQKQYMAVRGMEFEEEKNAILERLRQYHPEAFDEEGKPKPQKEAFVTSLKQKMKDYGRGLLGEFLGLETTFNILEGGDLGLLHESFVKRISDRSNWRTTRLEGVFKKLEPLFDQYSLVEKRQFSTKDIGGDIGIPITREKALGVALLAGNAEGKERLRNYGWSDEQIIKIIDLLDERDKKLAEGIWDIFDNDLWPDLKALNERTTGKAPPKVEATPYVNRLGTWGGGYYKLSYDKRLDERAFKFDADKAISELRNGLGMSGKTQQGSSKERQQGVKMRPRLDFGVFVETVTETVHDIAYREAIADVIRLMNNEDVREALKQIAGPEVFWAMRTRMAEVASAPKNPHGFIENFVSIARRNTIVNLMSGFGTAFQNLTGLIPASGRVNGWLLAREVGKFYSPKMGDMYQFATSKSEYMRHRFTSYEQDLVNAAKKLTVNGSIMPDTATFLALMGWVDRGVSVPVWNAAFAEGMEKYKGSDGLPDEKQAVEYADHIVRQTQGSGRIVDKPGIMTGHPLKTIFTMFHSYFNGQLQQLVRVGLVSKQEAKTDPRKATARVAMAFIVFWVLPALVTEFFKRAPDDEDDEEKLARYAKGLALYPAAMFPIVKDIAPWAWDKYVADSGWARSFRMSPIESAVEGIGRGIESTGDIASGEGDQKDVKNLIMGVGFAAGLPGKLVSDVITGTYDFATGEAGPEAIVLGPEPKK